MCYKWQRGGKEGPRLVTWKHLQAVKAYVAINEWQTKAIRDAGNRAHRRETGFVSNEEVDAWLASWGTRKRV